MILCRLNSVGDLYTQISKSLREIFIHVSLYQFTLFLKTKSQVARWKNEQFKKLL